MFIYYSLLYSFYGNNYTSQRRTSWHSETEKLYNKESYEEVIWDLIEDTQEVNKETRQEIEQARVDIKAGKFYTHEYVKKRLGL